MTDDIGGIILKMKELTMSENNPKTNIIHRENDL
jgi:hypothetical protein